MKNAYFFAGLMVSAFAAMSLAPPPVVAQGACRLCEDSGVSAPDRRPGHALRIDINTGIDFARYVLLDDRGGYAELDPVTGQRRTSGGLGQFGGIAVTARVTLQGEPGRAVRVELPDRIILHARGGDRLELTNLDSDLPGQPRLGPDGYLRFSVGGRIAVDGTDHGSFRGRIRVSANYE